MSVTKYSWTQLNEKTLIKKVDKTVFESSHSAIPEAFTSFFVSQIGEEKIFLPIVSEEKKFEVKLQRMKREAKGNKTLRMYWQSELMDLINLRLADKDLALKNLKHSMMLKFQKKQNEIYLEIINNGSIYELLIEEAEFESNVDEELDVKDAKPPEGNKNPEKNIKEVVYIKRDPKVKAHLIKISNGICENCGEKAFKKVSSKPYLEIHHLIRLSDNGPDTIDNAVAVCANCHRQLHYGINRDELIKNLYSKISRLKK